MSERIQNKRIQFDQTDCTLNPGELIQHSGIYEICHEDESRATVLLMRNTIFPLCRDCGERVRYKLLRVVPHISEDEDFREDDFHEDPDSREDHFCEDPGGDNPGHTMQVPTSKLPIQLGKAHGFRFQQDTLQTWRSGPESGDL
jgi:hypothetical protein